MEQRKKWMLYEKRWKVRDIYFNKILHTGNAKKMRRSGEKMT